MAARADAGGSWLNAVLPCLPQHAFERVDYLLDAVEVGIDAIGAAVGAQSGAKLFLPHEALGHAVSGAEVVWIEAQRLFAISNGFGKVPQAEIDDGALVVGLGE